MINECKIKNKFAYKIYGLYIESEITTPELLTANTEEYNNPDIIISYGIMPENIKQTIHKGITHRFEKKEMWFSIKGVATYYIYNGSTIIVEPYENGNKEHVKAFLLGSAFGLLLIQRNTIAIHGGSIVINGQVLVFTGESGAGKSTLTAALREKGYSFLADDVSVIGQGKDGVLVVNPGYPQQKLCKDTMEKIGYSTSEFTRINDDRDKYAIPIANDFIEESVSFGALFELTVGDVKEVKITKINGSEKLNILMKNIYRIDVTGFFGLEPSYFKKCVEIVKNIAFFRIVRPKDGFSVEEQIELINKVLA
jgi:hypothetical protein